MSEKQTEETLVCDLFVSTVVLFLENKYVAVGYRRTITSCLSLWLGVSVQYGEEAEGQHCPPLKPLSFSPLWSSHSGFRYLAKGPLMRNIAY